MKISYRWLKDFIDLPLSPEQTAEKLTLIGLEVDTVKTYGNLLDGVIVGEVLSVSDHPNADRLRLCQVNLGGQQVQIVCGAANVAKGQHVPVATVGAQLPGKEKDGQSLTIQEATLRGESSWGMICAEDELGLSEDHSGIMILDEGLQPGTPINEALNLYEDTIFDIEITPNRPDATSHLGIARDLAAALDMRLTKPFDDNVTDQPALTDFSVVIKNQQKCHRYVAKIVEDIHVQESPAWIKNRLKAIGIRPVNNIVDVTNYVMHEMGQPLHAFDRKKLKGDQIIIQDFNEAIDFETLDHETRTCEAGTLFICDSEEAVAIAGVMGGVDSEVNTETTEILIESAYFAPATIRKTAKAQALQTDASYRFERGINQTIQRIAAERAAHLIMETAGGRIRKECTDIHPVFYKPQKITLRKEYTNRLLGTDFSIDKITDLLEGLELSIKQKSNDSVTYSIPSFRPDIEREVDLIEEVGRLFDYNNIPLPANGSFTAPEPLSKWEQLNAKVKDIAKGLRFREIYTNSLISKNDANRYGSSDAMLHTLNPISSDMTTLRSTLQHGFLRSAAYNFNRNASGIRFFETGHVFAASDKGTFYTGIQEESNILFGLAGLKNIEHWRTNPEPYYIFDLKAVVNTFLDLLDLKEACKTHLDNENRLLYGVKDINIGSLQTVPASLRAAYEIDEPAFVAEFSITAINKVKRKQPASHYTPVPKFPAFDFDFGVIVDHYIRAEDLLQQIKETAGPSLQDVQIFDVFEGASIGERKKNIAFRLSFLDKNKTLTIKEVEPIIDNILDALKDKFSAELRNS